jgi:hypothetical protein
MRRKGIRTVHPYGLITANRIRLGAGTRGELVGPGIGYFNKVQVPVEIDTGVRVGSVIRIIGFNVDSVLATLDSDQRKTVVCEKCGNGMLTPQDELMNQSGDVITAQGQFSAFNGTCKIYSPRYRQLHFGALLWDIEQSSFLESLQLACSDVERAFDYYLGNYNEGRVQGNYHISDYALFYTAVRENAEARLDNYLQ